MGREWRRRQKQKEKGVRGANQLSRGSNEGRERGEMPGKKTGQS